MLGTYNTANAAEKFGAEKFILISTECHGYREKGKYDPLLDKAVLPDYFEIDHVRVFDRI